MGNAQSQPEIGMGVTYSIGSDRYPYTVVEIVNHRTIKVQEDIFKRTDENGFSESQTYEYSRNKNAPLKILTLRKNGRWVQKGNSLEDPGRYWVGQRNAYQDPSF